MSVPGSRTASPPRSAPAPKKKRTPRPPATHPTYVEMIRAAITALKERGGSSRQKILGYIQANYDIGNERAKVNARLRTALKSGVEKGVLIRSANSKGTGANGSFRVGKALPKKKGKRSPRKAGKARKAPRKRRSPKKSARKAKKPRRSAKKSPKKKARKAPARKPRRSPKKKAGKSARKAKPKSRGTKKARR